jgi:hypothetical protein
MPQAPFCGLQTANRIVGCAEATSRLPRVLDARRGMMVN